MKTCKRGTDDYASCMRLAFQENWPTIVKGNVSLTIFFYSN